MSFIANAISNFFSSAGSDRSFIERLNTPATIPISSAKWVVDPSAHKDLSITVKGSLALGRVRYAGLDSVPPDGPAQVHAKIETSVHVSHLDLAPLVTVEVQGAGGSQKAVAHHGGQWNLTITTPTADQVPKSVGSNKAGIDVDVLVTMVPGTPADGSHSRSGSADAFNSVKVETVNLSHSWLATKEDDHADSAKDAAIALPSSFLPPKPTTHSLDVSTTNGDIALTPSGPWSVGRRLSVTSMNGVIAVSGPLHLPASHADTDSPTRVELTTTNGSVTSHIVGASAVESSSTNGRVRSWTDRVHLTKAESVNGSVAVYANDVPAGGNVSGSSVNGRVSVLAALAEAVDRVRLSASSTVGSVLAEVMAAGWPAASQSPTSGFVGKKVVLDLKSLRDQRAAVEAHKVMVNASTVNGSASVAIVDAREVLKV